MPREMQLVTVSDDVIVDGDKIMLTVPLVRNTSAYRSSCLLRIDGIARIRIMYDSDIHGEHDPPTYFKRAIKALPES
jgi:hypothetical protein